jgi:hypothetical protein
VINEQMLRSIVVEEIKRLIPQLDTAPLLTLPQAMKRYRCDRVRIMDLIRSGEVTAVYRQKGKNGRPQYLVVSESAEKHPALGGAKA